MNVLQVETGVVTNQDVEIQWVATRAVVLQDIT